MLVLSRKFNEEILIDGDIRIKVIEISGNRVRLGVCAPATTSILRAELQNTQSSQSLNAAARWFEQNTVAHSN